MPLHNSAIMKTKIRVSCAAHQTCVCSKPSSTLARRDCHPTRSNLCFYLCVFFSVNIYSRNMLQQNLAERTALMHYFEICLKFKNSLFSSVSITLYLQETTFSSSLHSALYCINTDDTTTKGKKTQTSVCLHLSHKYKYMHSDYKPRPECKLQRKKKISGLMLVCRTQKKAEIKTYLNS